MDEYPGPLGASLRTRDRYNVVLRFLAPTRLRHPPSFFANFSEKWGRAGRGGRNNKMKLYLIFILIDLMVLLAYPVVFLLGKLRKILKFKR
jgi:hypothetical protein